MDIFSYSNCAQQEKKEKGTNLKVHVYIDEAGMYDYDAAKFDKLTLSDMITALDAEISSTQSSNKDGQLII